jgi:hypothetical protein
MSRALGRGQRWRPLRESGLRSTAAACFEGGRAEFNDGGVTMTKSLRKRTVVARSETGVDAATCSEAGDEVAAWSRARIGGDMWRRRHDGC